MINVSYAVTLVLVAVGMFVVGWLFGEASGYSRGKDDGRRKP